MRKITVILFLSLLCSIAARSQTYYYSTTKTISGNGFTYKCDNKSNWVTLYNAENKFTYTPRRYKDGSILAEAVAEGYIPVLEKDTWTKPAVRAILRNTFTSQERAKFRAAKSGFILGMIISPETGRVIEVNFEFSSDRLCATIPVAKYRAIELQLKNDIWFTPTEVGRQLNFLMRNLTFEFAEQ